MDVIVLPARDLKVATGGAVQIVSTEAVGVGAGGVALIVNEEVR